MGCRCCKMIQSYIFDPQEVQTSGYVNEINNYKSDEQDGGKFKGKHNNEIQVHKNELQNTDSQLAANRHKLNNTKDAIGNHRSTALHKEGLGNCVEKYNFNINGLHSYSGINLSPNPNQSKEVSTHVCSGQLPSSSAQGLPQPKECDNDKSLDAEYCPKLSSEATENVHYEESQRIGVNISAAQSAILEAQDNGVHLPGLDDAQHASHPVTERAVGSEPLPNNHTHTDQSTECTTVNKHGDLPLCESRSCAAAGKACSRDTLNVNLKDKNADANPAPRPKTEAVQEIRYVCHEEINGELDEEEDADVAEALAALEAATAGEDSDEEEEY
ncbi:uncharacterized protein C4orf19 homolog [Hemicordylus capensis]|uniref:uncharacterized protein C4orf19 homolog n=1 Tax=Hemicordylus capensis TaxID=884348 RepID=UPI002304CDB3|nr:uncharacterized protein C4orf19 homolog [Hemicordylus capensis]XP_053107190.1 uncharacterized protein C4orf19 homolog [Hemicordylus capensis]XP_053107191.1 uncharacterized protein C4orf19 homolog [Hemicordylus capensis]